jgi:phosphatidylinositol alpha-mannosyltransferase
LLRVAYGKSINRLDCVLSVSSASEQYAKSAFRLKSKILPNVVDLSFFSSADNKTKTRDILFFGRLVQRKGAKELICAFNILQQHDKKARLTIAGTGPMEQELKKLVDNLGISEKVEFLGFIEEADKPRLLASADIACYPSTGGESFGIVLIEAMAAGAGVVIGGDNVGYRSVLGKKPQLLFNPKNALSFAGNLSEFRDDNNLKTELHKWQQNEVKQYDVNIVGSKLVKIYNEAIAKH